MVKRMCVLLVVLPCAADVVVVDEDVCSAMDFGGRIRYDVTTSSQFRLRMITVACACPISAQAKHMFAFVVDDAPAAFAPRGVGSGFHFSTWRKSPQSRSPQCILDTQTRRS